MLPAARPAQRFELNAQRDVSLLDDGDVITGLEVVWRAHGGRTDGDTVAAVELLWWDGDGWHTVDDGDLVDWGAGCLRTVFGADEARLALQRHRAGLALAMSPRGPWLPAPFNSSRSDRLVTIVGDDGEVMWWWWWVG